MGEVRTRAPRRAAQLFLRPVLKQQGQCQQPVSPRLMSTVSKLGSAAFATRGVRVVRIVQEPLNLLKAVSVPPVGNAKRLIVKKCEKDAPKAMQP